MVKSVYDEMQYDLTDKEFVSDKTCLEIINKCNITFPKSKTITTYL